MHVQIHRIATGKDNSGKPEKYEVSDTLTHDLQDPPSLPRNAHTYAYIH